jgi:hypothetical protein
MHVAGSELNFGCLQVHEQLAPWRAGLVGQVGGLGMQTVQQAILRGACRWVVKA